jgi:hypothetical protein
MTADAWEPARKARWDLPADAAPEVIEHNRKKTVVHAAGYITPDHGARWTHPDLPGARLFLDGFPEANTQQAVANFALATAKGIKVKQGWTRRAPAPFIEKIYGSTYTFRDPFDLLDHKYRLLYPDGSTVFVSEPYGYDERRLHECALALGPVAVEERTTTTESRQFRLPKEVARV